MHPFLLLRSTQRRLLSHRKALNNSLLRPFSSSSQPAEDPIDPRTLPTDYDPSTFNPESPNPPPSPRVWRLVDEITALTLADIADLSQILVHQLNLEKPPTIAVMGAGSAAFSGSSSEKGEGGEKVAAPAEKTVFEIKLEGFDAASKIKVIKEVRGFTDLGLKEAKELVEKAPVVVKGGFSKEEGLKIVEKMKAVGAKVVLE